MKPKKFLVRGTFSFEVLAEDEQDALLAVEFMQDEKLPHVSRIAYIIPNEAVEL